MVGSVGGIAVAVGVRRGSYVGRGDGIGWADGSRLGGGVEVGEGVGGFAGTGSSMMACSITCGGVSACRGSAVADSAGARVVGDAAACGFPRSAAAGAGAKSDGILAGVGTLSPMGSDRGAGGGGRVLYTGPR